MFTFGGRGIMKFFFFCFFQKIPPIYRILYMYVCMYVCHLINEGNLYIYIYIYIYISQLNILTCFRNSYSNNSVKRKRVSLKRLFKSIEIFFLKKERERKDVLLKRKNNLFYENKNHFHYKKKKKKEKEKVLWKKKL